MNSSKDSLPFWCPDAYISHPGEALTFPEIAARTGLTEAEVLSAYASGLRKIRLHRALLPKFQSSVQLLAALRAGRESSALL
jgi:hypothetical protein